MRELDDLDLPVSCPFCGHTNDRHRGVTGPAKPDVGDFALCWECQNVFVFDSATTARRPTAEEQAQIDADPRMTLARAAIRGGFGPTEAVTFTRSLIRDEPPPEGATDD